MLFNVILVCFIFGLVNGDTTANDIRAEEEKRHNETLAQYVKASVSGALSSLFPSLPEQERALGENLFADVFPIGDSSRPLPETAESIETQLCRNHRERGEKILLFSRKRWPTALITQITVRLGILSVGDKNDAYCRDAASRSIYTTNATIINKEIAKTSVARNNMIDNILTLLHGNSSVNKLAGDCCAIWNLKAKLIDSVQTPETKHFVKDYFEGYNGKAIKYICVYHSEGSKACADLVIPPPPANIPRYTSVYYANLELLAKITSIH